MNELKQIVIVGGGTAGWMAASLMQQRWQGKAQVTLIESPDIGIIGVGEGSTPTLKRFFQLLNVTDQQWMPACNATYKVNIRFNGWSPASGVESYSHPFISQTDTFTQRAFMVNCRTRRLGLDTHTTPADFLLNGVLAKKGLSPITPENFPFRMEYGYHFDSHLLGNFLAELAVKRGVNHIQAKVTDVNQHANDDIQCVVLEDGQQINGDLFIDCSGFSGLLLQQTLKVQFVSFKENLFNNAAVVAGTDINGDIPVETESTALSNGWCWKIPLTNRFGNGYVYSQDFIEQQTAEDEFRKHLGLAEDVECRHLKMKVGRVEQHWKNNCVGLGLSQGFIEPLEATALHLVQVAIELFISKFEEGQFTNKHQAQYNQLINERFERVRDYIVAHYKLNTRDDSEYWQANRANNHLSDSLLHILDTWYRGEDLSSEIERQNLSTHFNDVSWNCLLSGYGTYPKLAANQPGQGDLYKEQNIQSFLTGCAMNFSPHTQSLQC